MKGQIVGMVVDKGKVNAPGVEMECAAGQDGKEMDVMVIWEKLEKDMFAQKNPTMVGLDSIASLSLFLKKNRKSYPT